MALTEGLIRESRWSRYFQGLIRVDLIPKEMAQQGKVGFEGWIRTTWHPVIERIPEDMKEQFVSEMAERYLEHHPLEDGLVKVGMVRLQVEARRSD